MEFKMPGFDLFKQYDHGFLENIGSIIGTPVIIDNHRLNHTVMFPVYLFYRVSIFIGKTLQ